LYEVRKTLGRIPGLAGMTTWTARLSASYAVVEVKRPSGASRASAVSSAAFASADAAIVDQSGEVRYAVAKCRPDSTRLPLKS
jgi:hypothetical protein